ncbi:Tm-1-like ATP-binding domain-containing protein [Microdochium nivale]|nr:Tm-1-like ATP-binding domain-containing protein [Microdochium nivale]
MVSSTTSDGPTIALIGTCDSKLRELLRLRELVLGAGAASVVLIDGGRYPISHEAITASRSQTPGFLTDEQAAQVDDQNSDRSGCLKIMAAAVTEHVKGLYSRGEIHGVLAAGGSGGTSLAAPAMREALPIGFPKLLVSTVASGDVGPIVGEADVTMMYSVVDIAGSNELLDRIFANAAGAVVGMAKSWRATGGGRVSASSSLPAPSAKRGRKRIGITMFGVTTPCVDKAREILETRHGHEVFVFHATGHGGRAMERLVDEGRLDAVLDLTTTEVCDELSGGNMTAGPHRLEAAVRRGIPCVVSVGATDMVNFGPRATVPEKYSANGDRLLYEHNAFVTLMRTTPEECRAVGSWIAGKLKGYAKDPSKVKVVLPTGGVSLIATLGGPFADDKADEALFDAIRQGLVDTDIEVVERPEAINSDAFAECVVSLLTKML